jgi:hypothetical protein
MIGMVMFLQQNGVGDLSPDLLQGHHACNKHVHGKDLKFST